jgi:outer membrane protein assembly factor BamB
MHRSNIIANIRGPFRLFLTLLVLVVLTGGQWTANASAPNPESDETPVDLAAMVLRGSDLEAEGFPEYGETRLSRDNKPWSYVPTGSMTLPEAVDLSVADETPKAEIGQLYLDLEATGWQRQFRSLLTTQQSAVDQVIASSVGIYADASGASDAFQLLTETSGRPDVEEIELTESIGNESIFSQDTTTVLSSDDNRLILTFHIDNFIASVSVFTVIPGTQDPQPVVALAQRLAERIERVRSGDQLGLSALALHLENSVSPIVERYDKLAGDVITYYDDTADARSEREETLADRTDVFRLDQLVPVTGLDLNQVPRYNVSLFQFKTSDAASEFVASVASDRGEEPISTAQVFGDESVTIPADYEWDGVSRLGFRIYLRVGSIVATLAIDATVTPDLDALQELATLQTDCLEAEACPDTARIPTELLDLACTADPTINATGSSDVRIEQEMPMIGGNPAQTGAQPGPGPEGEPGTIWQLTTGSALGDAAVISNGILYARDGDGVLYALDAATGERQWCIPTGASFDGTPAIEHGLVINGLDDPRVWAGNGGAVVAVDAQTGEERWRVATGGAELSPVIADSIVFVPGRDAVLLAIDLQTGEVLWRFAPSDREDAAFLSVVVAEGVVYANLDTGAGAPKTVYALDVETGDDIWSNDQIDEETFISGSLTVADGSLFVPTSDGSLFALDAKTGDQQWRFTPETNTSGTDDNENFSRGLNSPAVVDGVVYIGNGYSYDNVAEDAFLFAVDAGTGDELWRYATEGPVESRPSVTDGVVYCGDAAGMVSAVNADSGDGLWTFDTSGANAGSPTIVDGVVFVTNRDGALFALAGSEP